MSRILPPAGVRRTIITLVLLAMAVALAWGWYGFTRFAATPLAAAGPGQSIEVPRGSNLRGIVGMLQRRGSTRAPLVYWRLLALELHAGGRLHAGEYALPTGITPRRLLEDMAAGRVVQHFFTIVEGWTFRELRAALDRVEALRHDGTALDDAVIMRAIGAPDQAPEGLFLPETYAYLKGDSDLSLLRRAHAAMERTLDQLWPGRDPGLPLATPYEALILASLVEKETARADERAKIAGVFIRRLQQHMPLQTDPSVIYGIGASYAGNIHKSDLVTDTPYNTYTRGGLPPTPIALPGKASIVAALHPAPGDALYFVSRGDGSHVFSATLAEHNRHVACYQLKHCP